MTAVWALLAPMPLLIVVSALASGSETALFSLTRADRDSIRRRAPTAAAAVDELLSRPSRLLVLILLVNMLTNVAYFVLGAVASTQTESAGMSAAIGVGSVIMIVLFGEVLAKLLARTARAPFCALLAPLILALRSALSPILTLIEHGAMRPAHKLSGGDREPSEGGSRDLLGVIHESLNAGELSEDEGRLLQGVIDLGSARAADVMTPRVDTPWVRVSGTREDVLEAVRDGAGERAPVCDDSPETRVVGLLDVRAYLEAPAAIARVATFTSRALYVPETAPLDAVFEQMRATGASQAVCVDERGIFVGVVRPEDIAEELVDGLTQTVDEQDGGVRLVGLGAWTASGSAPLRDLRSLLGPDVEPRRGARTLGGMIHTVLGRVPSEGDVLKIGDAEVEVTGVDGPRVDRVIIRIVPHEADAE